MDSIQSIATDQPVKVRLEDGEVLSGALETENGEVKVLAAKERGPTVIVWSRVVSINVNPPPPWTWSGNIFFGGNEQSGNTDRASASFGAEATRKSSKDRYELSFLYNYAEEKGALTTRDAHGLIKYDYFFTRKFYGYLAVEMVKDRFRDLNLRTIVGPGIGYQIWDDKPKSLAFDGGITYFSEDRITADDKSWVAARLGAKFRYKFLKRLTFTESFEVFPNLESIGDFTLRNQANLISTISGPWALRISNIWDHDSAPAAGVKKDDFKTGANLQYSF